MNNNEINMSLHLRKRIRWVQFAATLNWVHQNNTNEIYDHVENKQEQRTQLVGFGETLRRPNVNMDAILEYVRISVVKNQKLPMTCSTPDKYKDLLYLRPLRRNFNVKLCAINSARTHLRS